MHGKNKGIKKLYSLKKILMFLLAYHVYRDREEKKWLQWKVNEWCNNNEMDKKSAEKTTE